jgi:hypothetical protein
MPAVSVFGVLVLEVKKAFQRMQVIGAQQHRLSQAPRATLPESTKQSPSAGFDGVTRVDRDGSSADLAGECSE